jgi:hypothetical protein
MPTTPKPIRNLLAGNMAVHRRLFLELGGYRRGFGNVQDASGNRRPSRFVTRQSGCEETDFCIRGLSAHPGRVWLFDPAVLIHHSVPGSRTRFGYFLSRCNDEGLAKASVVVEFAGAEVGLETERTYVREVLPRGVLLGFASVLRGDLWGPARAGAIVAGLATTAFAYGRARVRSRLLRALGWRAPGLVDAELPRS